MKQTILILMLLTFLASVQPRQCAASEPFAKVGTYSFQSLRSPAGARNLALGSVGTADDSDPRNQFYNPAVLYSHDGFAVSGGRANWIADIDFDDYAVQAGNLLPVNRYSRFRVAAALRYTVMKARAVTDRTGYLPEGTGRILQPQEHNVTFALAGGWYVGLFEIGAGFAVKRVTQDFADAELRGWAYDLGVMAKATFWRESPLRLIPSLGLSVLNLGPSVETGDLSADLPREGRFGAGLRLEVSRLDLAGRDVPFVSVSGVADYADSPKYHPDKAGLGIDVGLIDVVHFRLGYQDKLDDGLDGFSSRGFGLDWRVRQLRFMLDYAYYETTWFTPDAEAYSGAVIFAF